jgi:hypothetical protein
MRRAVFSCESCLDHENTKTREVHEARRREESAPCNNPFVFFALRALRPLRAFVLQVPSPLYLNLTPHQPGDAPGDVHAFSLIVLYMRLCYT